MRKRTLILLVALFSLSVAAQLSNAPAWSITREQSTAEGTVSPSTINVTTLVGVPVTRYVTITNTGTVAFTPLTAFNSDYGFFWPDTEVLDQEIEPLPGNNVLNVPVTFTPLLSGNYNAMLNVRIGDIIHYVSMHGTAILRGDADGDGHVTVRDISVIISALLEQQDYALSLDIDMNGIVNVKDISTLIDYLLSGEWPDSPTQPEMMPGIVTVNGVSFKMMPVKGGTFTMGATAEQGNDYFSNETPSHNVTISSFYLCETEVTQALWRAVMGNNPSYFTGDIMRPIEQVSWSSCQQFIAKLNQMTGYNFRLPTEAEWEYAARGGQASSGYKYSGSNDENEVAWYSYNSSSTTHPVATLAPNELGLYDMSGNVFEWCQDWFGDYTAEDQVNPTGPESGTMRVCRGGAWAYDSKYSRISYRYSYSPTNANVDLGFRLAIDSTFTPPVLPPFTLSCLEVNMEVDQVVKVGINNGSGNYSVASATTGIVDCAIEGDSIVLTGVAKGTTKVTLTDTRTNAQITFPVTVNAKDNAETFVVNGITFKMVPVEGGTFMMGATEEQGTDATSWEKPAHQESVSDFKIGQTEVTQALWLAVMGSNPSENSATLQHPVESVSWSDCQEFINRLNQLTGQEFRLPTEAEWEYAARGGNRSEGYKYSGSDDIGKVAWYFMNSCVVGSWSPDYGTHPVAKKSPNELGLYDMSGNVFEWCQDLFSSYTSDPLANPTTPLNDSTYVYRGGAWGTHDTGCRVSSREKHVYSVTAAGIGLRLACNAELDPSRLALSEYELNMDTGVTRRVKIINGSGQYTLTYDTTLVECHTDGDILIVTSKAAGSTVVTITDDITHGHTSLTVNAIEAITITVNGASIHMIKVEGGSFMMGAQEGIGTAGEKPAHKVNVSTFYISETEVPQKLWAAVLGYTPQNYTGDEFPYLQTSGNDHTLINKLNQKTGLKFRLPTEAEWEYAARGGNKSQGYRYAGSDDLDEVAWTIENCDGTPQPVKTKKPNELGLYDMSGNVYEWCLDNYYEYDLIEQTDPLFIGTSVSKIYRGGCVADSIGSCRTTWRSEAYPGSSFYRYGGLRLVLGDAIDPNALALSSSRKSIAVGCETSVEITNGSGDYTLDYDNGIVTCQLNDGNLVVTGTALGTANVVLTDQQTQQQCTLTVDVIAANTYTVNGITFSMIPVEGGTFTMGATEEQAYYASANERPAHEVTLSDYAIGQTEVTLALWNAVMNGTSDPSKTYPKTSVTLENINTFIGRLNALTGEKFRLPTEAEWEYAARGGNRSQGYLYCGSDYINDVAWFKYNSNNSNHPVALKQPNELGLYDMSGNVMEMCLDYFKAYTSEPETDPCNLTPSLEINSRGGNKGWSAIYLRPSARHNMIPSNAVSFEGFRLAMGAAQPSPEITATPSSLYINVGEQDSVTVKYGSGSYNLSSDKDIVTWEMDSDKVVFTATAPGSATITIEDAMSHDQTTVDIVIIQPTTYTVNGVSFNMIDVEGGTYTMGIPSTAYTQTYGHEVTLSDFSIGQTEVTKELWQAVMGGTETDNLQQPQASISWNKCQEFIMKLNELTGENFRLPTEAEWEFAALGGNLSHGYTYSGSNTVGEVAWYRNISSPGVQPVAQKKPNELMLYDMSGNVREFCMDYFEYYPRTPQVNPTGPASGSTVIIRGGDYFNDASWCEVKRRYNVEPTKTSSLYGLRLAKGDAVAPPAITLL